MVTESTSLAATQVRTFLIADVRGYTRFTVEQGDEAAAKLASRFAEVAETEVSNHDGEVIELRGDEALAVFSSARSALRASVALQAAFREAMEHDPSLPLMVGIGLDAGEAIPVKGGYRGGALNLAARLCSLAGPGEVLASDGVIHLARKVEGLTYSERGLVELKGFADPVKVMQVSPIQEVQTDMVATSEAPGQEGQRVDQSLPIGGFLGSLPSGTLVAREQKLTKVLAIVDVVSQGEGRLVLLAGEPGAGKTRLAQEITISLHNRGFLIAAGRCYEPRQTVPYYPFLDVLVTLYGLAPPPLRSRVSQHWPYLGRLLPEAGIQVPPPAEGTDEQERLFRSVTGFVRAMTEHKPVAILLDDLHWADQASLDLLGHLVRHTRDKPIFILGAYRDVEIKRRHPLEQTLRDLHRDGLLNRIEVRRLDQEGTTALMATEFGEEITAEFAALVYRHTEGNPFFTKEVLQTLVERGDVFRRDGVWERKAVSEIEVPESVRSAVDERVSRLKEETQEILVEASILGHSFRFEDVLAMSGRGEEAVESALEEALEAGLVREMGHDVYLFTHALIHQALSADLPTRRRRRLHQAAGEAMERLPELQRLDRVAELALHFLEADQPEKALRYSLEAGDRAKAVYAHTEAERHYRAALDLATDLDHQPLQVEAIEKLGTVLVIRGHYGEALAQLERAAEEYRKRDNIEGQARTVAQIGTIYRSHGSTTEGIHRVRNLLDAIEPAQPSASLAELYDSLANLCYLAGKYDDELDAANRQMEIASALGDDLLKGRASYNRGDALGFLGRLEEQTRAHEDGVKFSEAAGDLWGLANNLNNLAHKPLYEGRLNEAHTAIDRVVDIAERVGAESDITFYTFNRGYFAFWRDDWDEALRIVAHGGEMAAAFGVGWVIPYVHFIQGAVSVARGPWGDARAHLEASVQLSESMGDLQVLRHAHRFLGELDLLDGHADSLVKRLIPLIPEAGRQSKDVLILLSTLAWGYLELGKEAEAQGVLDEVIATNRALGQYLFLVDDLRIQGLLFARSRQYDKAAEVFAEAVSLAHPMPHPYAEARALYEWGLMEQKQGNEAASRQHLEEALGIFEHLGARPYVEWTKQTLGEMGVVPGEAT